MATCVMESLKKKKRKMKLATQNATTDGSKTSKLWIVRNLGGQCERQEVASDTKKSPWTKCVAS